MNAVDKLPLESLDWRDLETFAGTSSNLPIVIRRLLDEPLSADDPLLDELASAIFHQYSLVSASYAAFPYLLDVRDRLGPGDDKIFFLAANMAASVGLNNDSVPDHLESAFKVGLGNFQSLAVSRIIVASGSFDQVYGNVQAALAFSGHCAGQLLMDVFEREGTKRTGIYCPHCKEPLEVALLDEGTVIVKPNYVIDPPETLVPINPPVYGRFEVRPNNAWHPVSMFLSDWLEGQSIADVERKHVELSMALCRHGVYEDTEAEYVFSLIGSVLYAHGFRESALRFYRFWDILECPRCKRSFPIAKGWWGCADDIDCAPDSF